MAFVTLEDFSGTIEAICFPETYARHAADIAVDAPVMLYGKLSTREGEQPKIIVESLRRLEDIRAGEAIDVHIDLDPNRFSDGLLDDLDRQCEGFRDGNGFLFFHVPANGDRLTVRAGSAHLRADRDLVEKLREIFGSNAVSCRRG